MHNKFGLAVFREHVRALVGGNGSGQAGAAAKFGNRVNVGRLNQSVTNAASKQLSSMLGVAERRCKCGGLFRKQSCVRLVLEVLRLGWTRGPAYSPRIRIRLSTRLAPTAARTASAAATGSDWERTQP